LSVSGRWYLEQGDGGLLGPLSWDELRQMAAAGRLGPDDLIRPEGAAGAVRAATVADLFAAAPAAGRPGSAARSPEQPEGTIWGGRPSQVVNLGVYILCGLTCWLVVPVIIAVWKWLETRSTAYELTAERLRVTTGMLSRRTDEVELYRVKDTVLLEPFALRLFQLGTVVLRTSDVTTPKVSLQGIPNARQVQEAIRARVEIMRDRKRVREVD
jgi:membrane protein YdbS with pleckstrin-like domain